MDLKNKVQYIVEEIFLILLCLGMLLYLFLGPEKRAGLLLIAIFIMFLCIIGFTVLKRQGKWFKGKDFFPKWSKFAFCISVILTLNLSTKEIISPVIGILWPMSALVLIMAVNYKFNFGKS